MSGTSDFKLDETLVAGAAEVIHGYTQSRRHLTTRLPLSQEEVTVRYARMADAEGAILFYLRAMRERGYELMPRDPTDAMHREGMATRQMQDNLNKAHHVIIDTSDVWRAMFDAALAKAEPQQ